MDIPCPHCGQISKQLVRELVDAADGSILCMYCRCPIDLESYRTEIFERAKTLAEIKSMLPGERG
jgi:hypothetical protein